MPKGVRVSKLKLPRPRTPWDNMTKDEVWKVLREMESKIEKQKHALEKLEKEKDQLLWFLWSNMKG